MSLTRLKGLIMMELADYVAKVVLEVLNSLLRLFMHPVIGCTPFRQFSHMWQSVA